MRSASYRLSPRSDGASPRRRATALLLTVAVHLLLLLMLLRLAPFLPPPPPQFETSTFDVRVEGDAAPAKARAKATREAGSARGAPPPPPPKPRPDTPPEPGPITLPPGVIVLSRQQFAAADISRLPRETAAADAADAGCGATGSETADAGQAGAGGADRLYDVEWYRKPTRAQLAFYLPQRPGLTGWGMIACRTIEDYRVDDCRELDQFPTGSGFARAVREAAWQFRVIPPRIGSRTLVGAWVRIRIDYVEGTAK